MGPQTSGLDRGCSGQGKAVLIFVGCDSGDIIQYNTAPRGGPRFGKRIVVHNTVQRARLL